MPTPAWIRQDGRTLWERAVLVHEGSAERHDAAAALWDAQNDPEWAAFERRCARIEREAARLDSAWLRLERLRSAGMDFAAGAVAHREQTADERERIANERERIADEREAIADDREELANQREHLANLRETTGIDPERQHQGRMRVAARRDRQQANALRQRAARQREVAARDRGTQKIERGVRAPELAGDAAVAGAVRAREAAAALSSILTRTAETLLLSAKLADRHAEREEGTGRDEEAATERRSAERARKAAARGTELAQSVLRLSDDRRA